MSQSQKKKLATKTGTAAAIKAAIANKIEESRVGRVQIEKAVKALIAFNASNTKKDNKKSIKNNLLGNDDDDDEDNENLMDADPSSGKYFWLVVSTKKMPSTIKIKPVKIPIVHSITSKNAEICLFTKDPQKEYKDLLEEKGIKIDKVIGVSKLKANYHSYESKRQLCDSFDLFLTDDRIVSLLPPLLGKTFFAKKRHPVPVNLKGKKIAVEIEKAISGTYLHLNKGLCNSVKIGTTNQTQSQVIDNIFFALETIVARIPGKWPNVQSIHVKLSDSVALPLYNSLPEADIEMEDVSPKKKAAAAAVPKKEQQKAEKEEEREDEEENDDDEEDDDEEMEEEPVVASPPAKKAVPSKKSVDAKKSTAKASPKAASAVAAPAAPKAEAIKAVKTGRIEKKKVSKK
ncbi:ribosomal protein L1p/L10e family-domain-containing protein [Obelidium mucronatum]|nr:ribosomal protein L1p/L10e family-domain-containing protein [Obelidium mucronatum]